MTDPKRVTDARVFWVNELGDLPIVQDSDHPLSLGYKIRLCTDDPRVKRKYRASDAALATFRSHKCAAMHVSWKQNRTVVIYLRAHEKLHGETRLIRISRVAALLAHEVSHMVDAMFENAHIESIDTELRAYHIDFFVEKLMWYWDPEVYGKTTIVKTNKKVGDQRER